MRPTATFFIADVVACEFFPVRPAYLTMALPLVVCKAAPVYHACFEAVYSFAVELVVFELADVLFTAGPG